jgi:hypothetical protein
MTSPENLPDAILLDLVSQTGSATPGTVAQYINANTVAPTPYIMPIINGVAAQILTTNGAGVASWQTGSGSNPFDQSLNIADSVSFASVATPTINSAGSINITTPTTQLENGLSSVNIIIDTLPRLTQDAAKTKVECGLSALQLAASSDALSDATTTYLSVQNAPLTNNMAVILTPDTMRLKQDDGAVNRIFIDDVETTLFTKSMSTGPSGAFLRLSDDSTWSMGSYVCGPGCIECGLTELSVVGTAATSKMTLSTNSVSLKCYNGASTQPRLTITTPETVLLDGSGATQLRIDTNGVQISNAYRLPETDGLPNQVLTTNGAGVVSFQATANPFNQSLNTANSVTFASVTTPTIDQAGAIAIGGTSATALNLGRIGITTNILGTTRINSAYTLPTADGLPNRVLTTNGAGVVSFQPTAIQTRIEDTGAIGSLVKCEGAQVTISTFYPPGGNLILDIQSFIDPGYVLTSVNTLGYAQWKLPPLGLVAFGGDTPIIGNFLRYSGIHNSNTTSVVSEVGNNFVVNQASVCTSVSYDTQTGDATTQFTIFKNGVALLTPYTLTGLRGVIPLDNFAFDAGDTCQIRYTAGTAPGRQTHTINFV